MVKITKVYTRTGDQGNTNLVGSDSISKCHIRIEAIGTIDELNAMLGLVTGYLQDSPNHFAKLYRHTQRIQNKLFDLGAGLSNIKKNTACLTLKDVEILEHEIDHMNASLPHLHSFILPGGSQTAATLHIARTVCRRAERNLVKLANEAQIEAYSIPYVNRLSDWLFVAARFVNHQLKIDEHLWVRSYSS